MVFFKSRFFAFCQLCLCLLIKSSYDCGNVILWKPNASLTILRYSDGASSLLSTPKDAGKSICLHDVSLSLSHSHINRLPFVLCSFSYLLGIFIQCLVLLLSWIYIFFCLIHWHFIYTLWMCVIYYYYYYLHLWPHYQLSEINSKCHNANAF